jgi:SAM-dependent methyltransferase
MPGPDVLAEMYGDAYLDLVSADHEVEDPKQPMRVLDALKGLSPSTFLDFGCGRGELLKVVTTAGWQASGLEFDPAVAEAVSSATGVAVGTISRSCELAGSPFAVVHLGDVVEHLTEPDKDFQIAVDLLRPGGILIAQGPLQNNATGFNVVLRATGRLRSERVREEPPTHVIQATAAGQRAFFRRFGLLEEAFTIHEVWWPAPASLAACRRRPRLLALHVLKQASLAITHFSGGRLGDRYFYVGRKPA